MAQLIPLTGIPMVKISALLLLLLPWLLTGCATPKYACGVPDGIGCKSLSEVHRMASDGTLKRRSAPDNRQDGQPQDDDLEESATDFSTDLDASPREVLGVTTVTPGTPILIPPRTLRVWVAPWPDEDGTLHDETYLYLRLDNGRWVME